MIRCENVSAGYQTGQSIIHDVNLEIAQGSFHFVLGTSGSGKSTLLQLLALHRMPHQGGIWFDNMRVQARDEAALIAMRRRIGMVFQDFRLIPHLSVADNLALPLQIIGAHKHDEQNHVKEMLQWIDMTAYADNLPDQLSGGQKQRVAIARAVMNQPDLVIADEPTGNLDPDLSDRIMYLLSALHKQGTTVIVATHEERLVSSTTHPVIRLEDGRVQQTTP